MSISFKSIPSNLRVPFVAVEFDASSAQQASGVLPWRVLILGQKTAAGTWTADTAQRATSVDQVRAGGGPGSQLHRLAKAWFANNRSTEVWFGVLADNGAGVAATGTFTVTGPATAAGTLSVYIGGVRVSVAVASGDAQNTIATALGAAITANTDLAVTVGVATNVVTVTAKNKGTGGNDLDLRLNYQDGEATPAGVSVAIVAMASGATNPVLTTLLAALGDTWYQLLVLPSTDATSLSAIEAELLSRTGPLRMIDGVALTSAAGTISTIGALGDTRNSPYLSILAQPGKKPLTPPAEFAAAVAGVTALAAAIDPARPFQTIEVAGVLPPAEADRFTLLERNLALYDGISPTKVGPGGTVQIERLISTSQTNSTGAADTAYLDLTTLFTLQYLRYTFRTRIQSRYPRHKLADDGTRFGAGQAVVTPLIAKAEAVNWYREMEDRGLVERSDVFKAQMVVERDVADRNRLNFLLPPDLINQLIVSAVQVQFVL